MMQQFDYFYILSLQHYMYFILIYFYIQICILIHILIFNLFKIIIINSNKIIISFLQYSYFNLNELINSIPTKLICLIVLCFATMYKMIFVYLNSSKFPKSLIKFQKFQL